MKILHKTSLLIIVSVASLVTLGIVSMAFKSQELQYYQLVESVKTLQTHVLEALVGVRNYERDFKNRESVYASLDKANKTVNLIDMDLLEKEESKFLEITGSLTQFGNSFTRITENSLKLLDRKEKINGLATEYADKHEQLVAKINEAIADSLLYTKVDTVTLQEFKNNSLIAFTHISRIILLINQELLLEGNLEKFSKRYEWTVNNLTTQVKNIRFQAEGLKGEVYFKLSRQLTSTHNGLKKLVPELMALFEENQKISAELQKRETKIRQITEDIILISESVRQEKSTIASSLMIWGQSLIIILVIIVGILFGRSITGPILALVSSMESIQNINLRDLSLQKIEIKSSGQSETKILEESFNSMIENLQQSIFERDQAEQKLKDAFELNSKIISESPIGISIYDETGQCTDANESIGPIIGTDKEQVLEQNFHEIESWKKSGMLDSAKKAISDQITTRLELQVNTTFGKNIGIDCYFVPFLKESKTNLMLMISDITNRKQAEEQIKASLKEKQVLIDEIHHRVKNNMQVISSLLKLQSNNIKDNQLKDILKESRNRVYAMSAVHETLHGSENLSEIDIQLYLSKITSSIFQTYSTNHDKVILNTDIEKIPVGINQASPLGLIINELISNSLKYAFPDDRKGEISVSIKKQDDKLELIVKDDGTGIPDKLDRENSNTLGLKLVRTLVENQLDGSIVMESKHGTKFTIKFNIESWIKPEY
jgi:PAS domain S-box-containing protein